MDDPSHPSQRLFTLLPSGRRYKSIWATNTTKLHNSFIPEAVSLLNTQLPANARLPQYDSKPNHTASDTFLFISHSAANIAAPLICCAAKHSQQTHSVVYQYFIYSLVYCYMMDPGPGGQFIPIYRSYSEEWHNDKSPFDLIFRTRWLKSPVQQLKFSTSASKEFVEREYFYPFSHIIFK